MIALDSDALSLAVKGVFNAGKKTKANQQLEEKRAAAGAAYINKLAEEALPVMISTITVAEYLQLFVEEDQAVELAALKNTNGLRIYPVDERAALMAAKLRRQLMSNQQVKDLYKGQKVALRSDIFIIATAVTAGAKTLVSYDERIQKLAKKHLTGLLTVIEFPVVTELQFAPPPKKDVAPPLEEESGGILEVE